MYTTKNFKSKKELKAAVAAGERVTLFQPGPFGGKVGDGSHSVEGPHYPQPHKWYARVTVESGRVIKVS